MVPTTFTVAPGASVSITFFGDDVLPGHTMFAALSEISGSVTVRFERSTLPVFVTRNE